MAEDDDLIHRLDELFSTIPYVDPDGMASRTARAGRPEEIRTSGGFVTIIAIAGPWV